MLKKSFYTYTLKFILFITTILIQIKLFHLVKVKGMYKNKASKVFANIQKRKKSISFF